MKTTVSYKNSPAPAFDAMQDIQDWLGKDRYEMLVPEMKKISDVREFAIICDFAGISGYPVKVWYEHFNGEGSWDKGWEEIEKEEKEVENRRNTLCP